MAITPTDLKDIATKLAIEVKATGFEMSNSEALQNAANLHRAMAVMNELRGDKEQSLKDYANCERFADFASTQRIKEGRAI